MKKDMDKLENRVVELVSQLTGRELPAACLEQPLSDIGVDSLMALELAVHLEREYGVRLEEEELASLEKLSDVVKKIGDKRPV